MGKVVNGLKCEQKNFEIDAKFNQKPVKLLEDGCNMVERWGSGHNTGNRVLDQLELMGEGGGG